MSTKNDVTGDSIQSKQNSDKFRSGWDLIDWSKKKQQDAMFKQETETNEKVKDGDANQTL